MSNYNHQAYLDSLFIPNQDLKYNQFILFVERGDTFLIMASQSLADAEKQRKFWQVNPEIEKAVMTIADQRGKALLSL